MSDEKKIIDLAARRAAKARRVNCLTLLEQQSQKKHPVVPGHSEIYDVTSQILTDHPELTIEELKDYLDSL